MNIHIIHRVINKKMHDTHADFKNLSKKTPHKTFTQTKTNIGLLLN